MKRMIKDKVDLRIGIPKDLYELIINHYNMVYNDIQILSVWQYREIVKSIFNANDRYHSSFNDNDSVTIQITLPFNVYIALYDSYDAASDVAHFLSIVEYHEIIKAIHDGRVIR